MTYLQKTLWLLIDDVEKIPNKMSLTSLAFLLRRQEDDRLVMLGFVADVDFPNSPTNKMPLHIVVKDGANVVVMHLIPTTVQDVDSMQAIGCDGVYENIVSAVVLKQNAGTAETGDFQSCHRAVSASNV